MRIEANISTGFGYGLSLSALAFLAAGGGHGIYVPMAVSSAPAAFFGVLAGFFGAPLFWLTMGALTSLKHPLRAKLLLGSLLAHYASAAFLVTREPYDDWDTLVQYDGVLMGAVFTLWAIVYIWGQIVIWHALFREGG